MAKAKMETCRAGVLGANIRSWRKAYGESIDELAEAINVSRSAVGAYESGSREPSKDTLNAIAKHYLIPLEVLLHGKPVDGKAVADMEVFYKNIPIMFPVFKCKEALKNDHYRRACDYHKEVYALLEKRDESVSYPLEKCMDEYEEALKDEEIKVPALANYIAFMFLSASDAKNLLEIVENKPAIYRKMAETDQTIEKMLYDMEPEEKRDLIALSEEAKSAEIFKEITGYIKILKRSEKWSDLADYYIALQYCLNIVDNDYSYEMNSLIGQEMMSAYMRVGNKHASRYVKTMLQLFCGN